MYNSCMIIDNKYTIPHTFLYGSLDYKRRTSALSMINATQDMASLHYSDAGLSMMHLQDIGQTWVIAKQRFEFFEYPMVFDKTILQTWAHEPKGITCIRDYQISFTPDGKKISAQKSCEDIGRMFDTDDLIVKEENVIMKASSAWIIINLETGRPLRANDFSMGTLDFCNEDAIEGGFPKITLPETWDKEEKIVPNVLDIDMNHHVNNLCYVRWILSSVDINFCKDKLLKILDTNFIVSAMFGDNLICRYKQLEDNTCIHSIIKEDGSEIFRARTIWAPEDELVRSQALYH